MDLSILYIVVIIAIICFFSSAIISLFLAKKLFNHFEKNHPAYYIEKGSPNFPIGFELISLSQQLSANRYLFSVLFGSAKNERVDDNRAITMIKTIRRLWFFVALPSWLVLGVAIAYFSIHFPNGVSY
jgi:hypothetical protein